MAENELLDFLATKAQLTPAVQQALATGTLSDRSFDPQAAANNALINKVKTEEALTVQQAQTIVKQSAQAPAAPMEENKDYLGSEAVSNLIDKTLGVSNEPEKSAESSEPVQETKGEQPSEEPSGEVQPESDGGDDDLTDKEINFKQLRAAKKELTQALKAKEKEIEEISTKVKKYETGEELPDVIKPLQERVAELEKYEKLHALKVSPAYKEAFVKPIQDINEKIEAIGTDYGIPEEVMQEALDITNRAELNRFLSNHFDDVGALEVKQLINKAQEIRARAEEAEEEPAKVLQQIEQEYAGLQEQKRIHTQQVIAASSKSAWMDAVTEIQKEGKALELIFKKDDPEHNKTYVEPLVGKAATEYAKMVKLLAQNGLEVLDKELAKAMAKMCLLSHASAVSVQTRAAAERELEELKNNTIRRTNYLRPSTIGTGSSRTGASEVKPPTSPKEAASRVLESIGVHG